MQKNIVLYLNNEKVAEASIAGHGKFLNSISSDGISVGKDANSPVTKTYAWPFPFKGKVKGIVIEQTLE